MQGSSTIVHGIVTDNATSAIHLDYADKGSNQQVTNAGNELLPPVPGAKGGSMVIDPDLTINGLWDVLSGNVLLHGGLTIAQYRNIEYYFRFIHCRQALLCFGCMAIPEWNN